MANKYISRVDDTNKLKVNFTRIMSVNRNAMLQEQLEKSHERKSRGVKRVSKQVTDPCGKREGIERLKRIQEVYSHFRDGRGMPKLFKDVDHMRVLIEKYFDSCFAPVIDRRTGNVVYDENGDIKKHQVKPFTISGLALALGFYDNAQMDGYLRRSLRGGDSPEFARILSQAKQRVREFAECKLYDRDAQKGAQYICSVMFKETTAKEDSDIETNRRKIELAEKEYELKKQLLEEGEDGDSNITVTIKRASKDGED